jgi:hypothetical protein
MERELTVRDTHGDPAAEVDVRLVNKHEDVVGYTDGKGRCRVEIEEDWLDEIWVDGEIVKRDVSLSGMFGGKRELELTVARAGRTGKQAPARRTLKLRHRDKEPVRHKEVFLFDERDNVLALRSDDRGIVQFEWAHDRIARVEVEQVVVKRDWKVEGAFGPQTDLELVCPRFEDDEELHVEDARREGKESGVRGQLFYPDGTMVREEYKVRVELRTYDGAGGIEFSTDKGSLSYCRDDGSFFIATQAYSKGVVKDVWVNNDKVPAQQWWRNASGFYIVLVPAGLRRKGGDKGGLIAGRVINRDGEPARHAKIEARVRSNNFLSFGAGDGADTYTDGTGRFMLIFKGGIELKQLLIDGNPPVKMTRKNEETGDPEELSAEDLKAGTFGVTFVREPKGLFGIF